MASNRKDPYFGYNFAVELDGLTRMGFRGCTGLDSSTTATPYREGTDTSLAQRELPSLLHHTAITLTRGITDDHALWDWRNDIAKGKGTRHDISIVLRNDVGEEKIRWNLKNAFPTKWSGPSLDATSEAIAIETLELTHEGVEVQKW
jgi:phage tail-like protein